MILIPSVTETVFEEIRDKVKYRMTEKNYWNIVVEKPKTKLIKREKKK